MVLHPTHDKTPTPLYRLRILALNGGILREHRPDDRCLVLWLTGTREQEFQHCMHHQRAAHGVRSGPGRSGLRSPSPDETAVVARFGKLWRRLGKTTSGEEKGTA